MTTGTGVPAGEPAASAPPAKATDGVDLVEDGERTEGGERTAGSGRAARGTALNLAGSLLGTVLGFLTVGLVTNHWGPDGAGLFFAATALFTLAANGSRMGSEAGLTTFVARLRAADDHRSVPTVVVAGLTTTGAAATAVGLAGLVFAPELATLIADGDAAIDDATTMLRILALAVPLFALSQAMFGASRGFATMRPSVLAGHVVRPASQLLAVATVIVAVDALPALAGAWAVSSALTLAVIAAWLGQRVIGVRRRHPGPGDPTAVGAYRRFAAGRAGADLVSAALERLDVILVAALLGQTGAGLYGAAGRLILAGQLLMIATAQSTAPLLSASFAAGRDDEARSLLQITTGWNVTLLWPLFIGLGFGAPTALAAFGPEFADGAPLVVVLSVAMLAIVAIGGGDTLLTSTGDSLASLLNHVVALAVLLSAAVILLPWVGLVGAALAWALSRLTLRVLAAARVWRTRGVHAIGRPLALAAGAATVAWVPTGAATLALLGDGVPALAVHAAIGGLLHLAILVRLRRDLELDRFVAVVTRRR
ncbi:MAG: oligosaccharide flippase family protein [Actinomycetota bacterium]